MPEAKKTIALAVTGSIAAYKSVELARLLIKAGHRVVPLMTASAQRFVGAVTLSGICGEPTLTEMWDPTYPGEMHVKVASETDVIAIVPATADVMARLVAGRADDLVTATVLCAKASTPVLVAPAMHPRMWTHPSTQRNVDLLRSMMGGRVRLVGPVDGLVASGEVGMGRMEEPAAVAAAIEDALQQRKDLSGRHVVVTAGPTHEPIDPVRFVGNRSSGKMGFALAERAAARGARVTLIAGPVSLQTPSGVGIDRRDVTTAEEMRAALADALGPTLDRADALIMSAAVADFRPSEMAQTKIKKDASNPSAAPTITLTRNPDLIAEIAQKRTNSRPVLVAFALETGDDATVLNYAQKKLGAKRVDLIVANAAHESLGRTENRVAILDKSGATPFESAPKESLADRILDRVALHLRS